MAGQDGRLPVGRYVGVSVGLHVVALVAFLIAGSIGGPRIDVEPPVIKTRLVKLGKKRDDKLLPRIQRKKPKQKRSEPKPAPAPRKAEPPVARAEPTKAARLPAKEEQKPEKPAEEPAEEEPRRSAKDILSDFVEEEEDEQPALTDKVRELLEEGDEEGSRFGEELSGRLRATYNDKLLVGVRRGLRVPATLEDRLDLKARLFIALGADGSLVDARITKSSGEPLYDNAVVAAAKKAAPFPSPPIQERAYYRRGVQMNVCPTSCR